MERGFSLWGFFWLDDISWDFLCANDKGGINDLNHSFYLKHILEVSEMPPGHLAVETVAFQGCLPSFRGSVSGLSWQASYLPTPCVNISGRETHGPHGSPCWLGPGLLGAELVKGLYVQVTYNESALRTKGRREQDSNEEGSQTRVQFQTKFQL